MSTPTLVYAGGVDTHIETFRVFPGPYSLITSPEFHMKQTLTEDRTKIYQITRSYRAGELGPLHNPEFTILEFYGTHRDYLWLMEEVESLVRWVATRLGVRQLGLRDSPRVDVTTKWSRERFDRIFPGFDQQPIEEVFRQWAQIEPGLGVSGPLFIYDFPPTLANLARIDPKRDVAERVELYIAGVELANGFTEITDPKEVMARFLQVVQEYERDHRIPPEVDLRYVAMVGKLPPNAGIAIGIDRLLALLAHAGDIHECLVE